MSSKKKQEAPEAPKTPGKSSKPKERIIFPENEKRLDVWVYDKPKTKKQKIKDNPMMVQGIWEDSNAVNVASPCEVWCYKSEPGNLTKHIHGKWGYKPGVEPSKAKPEEMWFFSPNATIPSYFTPQGTWMFPVLERDVSKFAPEESGFIDLSKSPKAHKLDVAGTWRLLYKADGEEDGEEDKPIGPGIKPRNTPPATPKKSPTPKKPPPKPLPIPDMNIYVRLPNDGRKIGPLAAKPDDTVRDIKDMVYDRESIPVADQRLDFGNKKDLADPSAIKTYGIKDGDVLDLQGEMEIYVKHWNGQKFTIKPVLPDDTIDDIQSTITQTRGIPRDQQRLIFGDKPLKDPSKTLQQYKIKHQSTLELLPMIIHVLTPEPQRKKITLTVDPDDTILDVKKKIYKKEGLPVEDQRLTTTTSGSKPLDDNLSTLTDNNIKHDDTLALEGITVTIRQPDGKTFKLDNLNPTDTIDDIQDLIKSKKNIPKKDQRLAFQNKPLKDPASTLKDNKIKNGSILDLLPTTMSITVRQPDGKTFKLNDLKPTDTIDDIQDLIQTKKDIPKKNQRLAYQNKPLKDPKSTLKDNKIKDGSVVDLLPMIINVKTPDNKTIQLQVTPDDKPADLKPRIESKTGIKPDEQRLEFNGRPLKDDKPIGLQGINHGDTIDMDPMKIYVKDLATDKTYTLAVTPTESINDVKRQVEKKAGIPKDHQRLTFEGTPLSNDKRTLRDYNVIHESTLHIEPMVVKVKTPDQKIIEIPVTPNTKPKDIKKDIEAKTNWPVDYQKLDFKGKPLSDTKKLVDSGVRHGDVIDLLPMHIYVNDRSSGKTHTLNDVNPLDSIDDIQKRITKEAKIPKAQQKLTFEGEPLSAPSKTLKDCNIQHESTLYLEPMRITVITPDGQKVNLIVNPSDKPGTDIKPRVEEKTGIPVDTQRLLFKGKPLDDRKPIWDQNVRDGDIIDMDDRMEIYVKNRKDDTTYTLSTKPNDSVDSVKQKVEKQSGVPKRQQRLTFEEKPLSDDSQTLRDCRIVHKSVLYLEPFHVIVQTPEGKKIPLYVDPNSKPSLLKKLVEDKTGQPVPDQVMLFNDDELDDNTPLDKQGVNLGDTIQLEPYDIYVKDLSNNKTYTLSDLAPSNTVDDVKSVVKKKTGVKKPRLTFQGKLLPDDSNKTLRKCGIVHKSTLVLEPFQVIVQTPDGKQIPLDVDPDSKPSSLKKLVEKKTGRPAPDQVLLFKDEELDDFAPLDKQGINHGDVIALQPFDIYVKDLSNNKTYTLADLSPSNTVDNVKSIVQKKTGVKKPRLTFQGDLLSNDSKTLRDCNIVHKSTLVLEPFQIIVQTPEGKQIPLNVSPDELPSDIKKLVEKKTGLKPIDQTMLFDDKELDDDVPISRQNVDHGDTLVIQPFEIYVKDVSNDKTYTLSSKPSDTIDSIKQKVQSKTEVPKNKQTLTFQGENLEDDGKTLHQYKIKHQSTLLLEPPIEIYIQPPYGPKFKVTIDQDVTPEDLKPHVQEKTKIPTDDRDNFDFKDQPLKENQPVLSQGVKSGDTITMPMVIDIRKPDESIFSLKVTPKDSIDDVKCMIKDKEGLPPQKQALFFRNKLLDIPKATLKESGIKHRSVLDLKDPEPKVKLVVSPRPKKKSYLPEDWKEKRKGYGEVVESFYKTNYSAENDDSFLVGKTAENRKKLEIDYTRPSERNKEDK